MFRTSPQNDWLPLVYGNVPPYPPYLPLRLCFGQVPKTIGFHWCTECPLYPPYPPHHPYLPLLTMTVPIADGAEYGFDQSVVWG